MGEKEIKQVYDNLSEENKEVINLVARGMQIAQDNRKEIKSNDKN